jgi:hypothetical protein
VEQQLISDAYEWANVNNLATFADAAPNPFQHSSPVQQASLGTRPVHQAPEHQVISTTSPVHQAPSEASPVQQASLPQVLPNLPALPEPLRQLQIEGRQQPDLLGPPTEVEPSSSQSRALVQSSPEQQDRITSLSSPEPTNDQQALVPASQAVVLPGDPPEQQQQLLIPASQELTLPDAQAINTPQAVLPTSLEITLPDAQPESPQLPLIPISQEVTLTDAPRLPSPGSKQLLIDTLDFDVERNYWAEPPPTVPQLVKKFEHLLVDVDTPNQWNTENSNTARFSSSTTTSPHRSSHSSPRQMSPAGKQPQRPEAMESPFTKPQQSAGAALPYSQNTQSRPLYPPAGEERPYQPPPPPGWPPGGPSNDARRYYHPSNEAGPSRTRHPTAWPPQDNTAATEFFRQSNTFPTYGGARYPYAPNPWAQREKELEAENERLRKAYEQERQLRQEAEAAHQGHPIRQPPQIRIPQEEQPPHTVRPYMEGLRQSRHAPSSVDSGDSEPQQQSYQTNLIEELSRFQLNFARNQMDMDERILQRITTDGQNSGSLKAADIGFFEPKAMPDSDAAITFIDNFNDAAIHFGADRTLAVLRKCCKNTMARSWVQGLNDADRTAIRHSLWHWERVVRRDFMPRPAQLYALARNEVFKWTQNRSPSEYITHKIRLLRIAGVTNEDHVVQELHDGFLRCPEMHIPMEAYVLEAGNDVAEYRRAAQRYQESAKLQFEYNNKTNAGAYTSTSRREKPTSSSKALTAGANKEQGTSTNHSYPRKESTYPRKDKRAFTRQRKCKNFPDCGDGEHFDWECKSRSNRVESKRAYYITNGEDTDDDGDEEQAPDEKVEFREIDSDLEEEYERQQNAHFVATTRADRAFMGATLNPKKPKNTKKTAKHLPPKPSECRRCHLAFPSRNQLHRHVATTGHNVEAPQDVIESIAHTNDDNDMSTLASFHYAKAQFKLAKGDHHTALACIDSGYGNSAVDQKFLETRVQSPTYRSLDSPVVVRGIGGAKVTCTKVAIFATYWPTIDGRLAKITRPYHIFPDLGCELLIGIDTIYQERIDMFFSSAVPQMRLGNCEAAAVRISVFRKELVKKVPVRAAKRTTVPPRSSAVVEIKLGRTLPLNQDYIFTPSRLKTITAAGAGAPHGVMAHDQRSILFTNVNDTEVTIYHNTVLGHLESIQRANHAHWDKAADDINAFLGQTCQPQPSEAELTVAPGPTQEFAVIHGYLGTKETFDPEEDTAMPVPDRPAIPVEPPRPRPVVSTTPCPDTTVRCAEESWVSPPWLQITYEPQYEYDLPPGIVVPTTETTTYLTVVINVDDDISPEQIEALRQLVARHPALFNDGMGCVREPIEDWLRLQVDRDLELKIQAGRPYNVSKRGEHAIDVNFDALKAHGRLETPKRPTPWGLKVFVIFKTDKERPVIDMRPLNAALPGDSYPLPKMEDIIEPLSGMRWLGTVDITSAFYQRLLHPDDRHRAAVVTHRGVEQFATSVMGGKTSVQHQQRLMDRRLISQLSWRGASCYVDDIVLYAPTFQKFLEITDEVFRILSNLGITLKAKKCFLGFHSVELLGYLVDRLGLTTTESKSEAVANIPFPTSLAQLEHFIGLTNWNRHLIPYYAQRVAPLQLYKTTLLKGAPISGRARKQYAAKTAVHSDDVLLAAFQDLKEALASRPRINHAVDGQPIYAFLDSSREYGTGLAVYQLTGDPQKYSKTRLVPLHFMSRKLSAAEQNYWPTDMEMSGLVWAVKKLRPYMERAFV